MTTVAAAFWSHRLKCVDQSLLQLAACDSPLVFPDDPSISSHSFTALALPEISLQYAPKGLEGQFQELYRLLRPALTTSNSGTARPSNASAFLQGARGTGKSHLLHQVLHAIRDEVGGSKSPTFRTVYINGLLIPGHSVHTVVREILYQLSASASDRPEWQRLKQTNFTNQLQLLTEMIQLASIDRIPILFIFDELDTFVQTTTRRTTGDEAVFHSQEARQLLLYHLLERVAAPDSACSFVGLTSDSSVMTQLEKRIKSRAEGTSKFIMTSLPTSWTALVDHWIVSDEALPGHEVAAKRWKQELLDLFQTSTMDGGLSTVAQRPSRLRDALQRQYRLGKDVRWLSRLLYRALALYRLDVMERIASLSSLDASTTNPEALVETTSLASYVEETLTDMTEGEPRGISALKDCSGPQVALVLAARRMLYRDSQMPESSTSEVAPLTLSRMLHEYQSFYKGQTSRYSARILRHNFTELLERGLFRPAMDHTSYGPYQYQFRDAFIYSYSNVDLMERMPLHMTVDIQCEVKHALDANLLQCSTALREWGRKTN
jgi:AAA ATPase domain/Origin recognition complex (ORC) subunit 4 C-terminus